MTASRPPILFTILLVTGILLAGLSATDLCNFGGCTTAHTYRFFGIHLAAVGLSFFGLLTVAALAVRRFPQANLAVLLLLAGGAGAELELLRLQKYVIQAWCPLCVGIAVVVLLLFIMRVRALLIDLRRHSTMNRRSFLAQLTLVAVSMACGFLISFGGISPQEAASAQQDASMGKQNSKVEVYVFSDWLCPICVKVEPAIEAALPAMEKKARIYFIDKTIHQESMNFVPYHLSFLVHEKAKYIQLRKALFALAKKTRNPTIDDVRGAIAPLGVTYKQLSFMEVTQMMGKAQALSSQFKVNATPTVVVANSATKKVKALVGGSEITRDNLLKAVNSME